MKTLVKIAAVLVLLLMAGLALVYAAGEGVFGNPEDKGEVASVARPAAQVVASVEAVEAAASAIGVAAPKQVLFGDFHVHTTFSFDAFMMSLPVAGGEGAHPPADACDFARFCSALDFWSINDHAEYVPEAAWQDTVESIRQCNAVADPANPDSVAFLGWEWTNVGTTPENHYGHKNVVLAHIEEGKIAPRPVAAANVFRTFRQAQINPFGLGYVAFAGGHPRYHDLARFFSDRRGLRECDASEGPDDYPDDCIVTAETPEDLFAQLDAWNLDAIVIPHGTAWGMYTPAGATWKKQLTPAMHDPKRQTLFEIYSGHGNSEQYRPWRAVDLRDDGAVTCPPVRENYLPTCQRAGQIIEERCLAEGTSANECAKRATAARRIAAEAGLQAHLTVPGSEPEDWLNAGQCQDCFEPAFNLRPGGTAQYVMALSYFGDTPEADPMRFRFGFMSSSDNHFARPGTGYKEVIRAGFTESRDWGGPAVIAAFGAAPAEEKSAHPRPFDRETTDLVAFQLFEMERQASYFLTGGLIAVHANGRNRGAIWNALGRREVYGTSGLRTMLWFDLLNPPGSRGKSLPMGAEIESRETPVFQVRAVGSFVQQPGCPDFAERALGAEDLSRICRDECYHPSDTRRPITRIEVVKITPQATADEPIEGLIQDPWRSFDCEPSPEGCVATFSDPDYEAGGRSALYYARAIEAPRPAINAGGVRCTNDAAGDCVSVDLCGGPGTHGSECLTASEPRAWSSPIFLDFPAPSAFAATP